MRVLVVIDSLGRNNGAHVATRRMIAALRGRGVAIDLLLAGYGSWLQRAFGVGGGYLCYQYNSPFLLLEALALFLFFARLKIGGVFCGGGGIAPLVFGVYVLHSNAIFRSAFHWRNRWSDWVVYSPMGIIARVLFVSALIFVVSIGIDWVRMMVFRQFKFFMKRIKSSVDDSVGGGSDAR